MRHPPSSLKGIQNLGSHPAPRIAVKSKGRIIFIEPRGGRHGARRGELHAPPAGNVSNSSFVEGIEARLSGDYDLRMRNGREYTVTRTYKKNLKDLAQLWIGTDGLPGD